MDDKYDLFLKILLVFGICVIGYFLVILPYLNRGQGDPSFWFYDVPVSETVNSSVIHLDDKDIMNIRGLDVEQKDGKISRIYFRYSQDPSINTQEFYQKYGSRPGDPSSRKYLEYKGIYYYAIEVIP